MEFAAIVYLIGTVLPALSGIGGVLVIGGVLIAIVWVCGFMFWADSDYEPQTQLFFKFTKKYLIWAAPIVFICSLIPDKETSYTMIAAYTAQKVGESDKVQQIAGQSLEIVEAFLAKTKKELEADSVEKSK